VRDDAPDDEEPPVQEGATALLLAEQARVAAEEPDEFLLWPEHEPALQLFLGVETQFRYGPAGLPTGLDYAGVRASPVFAAMPPDQREAAFLDVCAMERAWINAKVRAERDRRQCAKHFGALGRD
jgi:hypothetical protein